jgi:hypothetical protein
MKLEIYFKIENTIEDILNIIYNDWNAVQYFYNNLDKLT